LGDDDPLDVRYKARCAHTVEYILFPDEGHGWRKVANRVRSTTALVDFFRQHLSASAP
jgi:dipeptidyl aminopeptidase/acylaminoacyl peptidase